MGGGDFHQFLLEFLCIQGYTHRRYTGSRRAQRESPHASSLKTRPRLYLINSHLFQKKIHSADGIWTSWRFTKCSLSCGEGGTRSRVRECQGVANGGIPCQGPGEEKGLECSLTRPSCPVVKGKAKKGMFFSALHRFMMQKNCT